MNPKVASLAASLLALITASQLIAGTCLQLAIDQTSIIETGRLKPIPVGLETEVELSQILAYVGTSNGKVSGFKTLAESDAIPEDLIRRAGAKSRAELLEKEFDFKTPLEFKRLLVQWVIDQSLARGGSDKSLSGLILRDDIGSSGPVDWETPNQSGQEFQIEFKRRHDQAIASNVHEDLWSIERRLFGRQHSHHIHMLFNLHHRRLLRPLESAAELVDIIIRVNFLAEMQTILARGANISRMMTLNLMTFGPLSQPSLANYIDHISHLMFGEQPSRLESSDKMAWVAFRGVGLYDDPHAIGIEFRAANYKGPNRAIANLVDALQLSLNRLQHSEEASPSFKRWWKPRHYRANSRSVSVELKRIFADQWYVDSWPWVWRNYDRSGLPAIPDELRSTLIDEDKMMQNRLLFYDWARRLPLIASQPDVALRIRNMQSSTLQKLRSNMTPAEVASLTQDFINRSELYQLLFRSLLEE